MADYQPITRSQRIHGRYVIGTHVLVTGDVIDWVEGNAAHFGTIEYTYAGYFVRTPGGTRALRELVQSRCVARVRLKK